MADSTVRLVFLGNASSAVRSVRTLESSFSGLGRTARLAATAVGTTIVASLALAVKAAVGFDRAMRNVQSITKSSEKEFQSLSRSVLALAKTTGQGPKTLAEGLYSVVSSGFKANDAITILRASAKAATAGLTDTATATKAVVAVLNAYHLSASKARQVSDTLFQEVNLGVNTFEELAQNIGDTAPQAAALKVPFQEVAAALATITLHGTSMAEASTQVSRVLTAMVKPTKDLAAEFKHMGFENGQAAVAALGFSGVMRRLSVDSQGNQQKLAAWLGDIRGIRGVINLTGANLESYTGILKKMGLATEGVGATQKAFAEQSKSISFQWQVAKASLTAAAIPIGQLLFPALIKAAHGVEFLATQIQQHMPQIRAVTRSAVAAMIRSWGDLRPTLKRTEEATRELAASFRSMLPGIGRLSSAQTARIKADFRGLSQIMSALAPVVRQLAPVFRVAFTAAAAAVKIQVFWMTASMKLLVGAIHAVEAVIHGLIAAWNALKSAASHVINFRINIPHISLPHIGLPHIGRAMGGFIPGIAGEAVAITAHAGEVIVNPARKRRDPRTVASLLASRSAKLCELAGRGQPSGSGFSLVAAAA